MALSPVVTKDDQVFWRFVGVAHYGAILDYIPEIRYMAFFSSTSTLVVWTKSSLTVAQYSAVE
jgi:hypothetical protein